MEDVLEIYHLPYDPNYPVVCMDEPCNRMIGEVRDPIPCAPGPPAHLDDEYVRKGVVEIFMEVEPLAGKRHIEVTEHRTRKDWAIQIQQMLEERRLNNAFQIAYLDGIGLFCFGEGSGSSVAGSELKYRGNRGDFPLISLGITVSLLNDFFLG